MLRGVSSERPSSRPRAKKRGSEIFAVQVKMARMALGWGLRELAKAAKVSGDTVNRLEKGEELRERTLLAIRETFEKAGVVFIAQDGGGPGVRLAKPLKRKRAK
jgi:transcriptional regulator with XRE-family HTH domain